jgi:rhamnulokinase
MGLWLLQESVRTWQQAGHTVDLRGLVAAAADVPALVAVVDPDDPEFLSPGDMPARIAAACVARGQPAPQSRPEIVRCILDSLALGHRRAVRAAQQISGRTVDSIHLVGGGAHNGLLCQLTADACALPVLAGPTEATALGNLLVQARALGAPLKDLQSMRALVRSTQDVRTYSPRHRDGAWDAAEAALWS